MEVIENKIKKWLINYTSTKLKKTKKQSKRRRSRTPKPSKKFIEQSINILDYLMQVSLRTKFEEGFQYINVCNTKLVELGGSSGKSPLYRYSSKIECLSDLGYIQINPSYSSNGEFTYSKKTHCKSYAITTTYLRDLLDSGDVLPKKNRLLNPREAHAVSRMNELEIDETCYQQHLQIHNDSYCYENLMCLYALKTLRDKHFFAIEDAQQRMHTNITGLKKEFRDTVRYKEEYLYEVDIRCAQPFISLHLVSTFGMESEFLNNVCSGELVPYLHQECLNRGYNITAESIKKALWSQLFFKKPENQVTNKGIKLLEELYPYAYLSICSYRDSIGNSAFAKSLQILESKVMNNTIDALEAQHPDIFLLRLHDCLICNSPYQDVVAEEIKNHCQRLFSRKPAVKQTRFG